MTVAKAGMKSCPCICVMSICVQEEWDFNCVMQPSFWFLVTLIPPPLRCTTGCWLSCERSKSKTNTGYLGGLLFKAHFCSTCGRELPWISVALSFRLLIFSSSLRYIVLLVIGLPLSTFEGNADPISTKRWEEKQRNCFLKDAKQLDGKIAMVDICKKHFKQEWMHFQPFDTFQICWGRIVSHSIKLVALLDMVISL